MEHKEFRRLNPKGDVAVMFIHGIAGTPKHFVSRIPLQEQVPEEWSVYNVLLDGHGLGVDDFSRSSMKKWKEQLWRIFNQLSQTHQQVILVGHSMGTLFSIQLALENPGKIPFLFLLGVPMRPGIKPHMMVTMLRLSFGKIREDRPTEAAVQDACGVRPTPMLWKYIGWIPRMLELLAEIHLTEKEMDLLTVETVAYQSRRDEMVTNLSKKVLEKCHAIKIIELPNSAHFYYHPDEADLICRDFRLRCEEIKKKKA